MVQTFILFAGLDKEANREAVAALREIPGVAVEIIGTGRPAPVLCAADGNRHCGLHAIREFAAGALAGA